MAIVTANGNGLLFGFLMHSDRSITSEDPNLIVSFQRNVSVTSKNELFGLFERFRFNIAFAF